MLFDSLHHLIRCANNLLCTLAELIIRCGFIETNVNPLRSKRCNQRFIWKIENLKPLGTKLLKRTASEHTSQNRTQKWIVPSVLLCKRQNSTLNFLSLVPRMLRVPPPCYFDERDWLANLIITAISFNYKIQIVKVSI